MDLNEHGLTESERFLKRLGVTHVLLPPRPSTAPQSGPAPGDGTGAQPAPPDRSHSPAPATGSQPLPALLRALFHGKHGPLRTMWTYCGLHQDMQCPDIPPRLVVFRKIQETVCSHLKWSPGDISSWPMDIEAELFRAGLEHFRPRTALVFQERGEAESGRIGGCVAALKQAGCHVVMLPCLDEMARGNQQLKNEAWKILQTIPA